MKVFVLFVLLSVAYANPFAAGGSRVTRAAQRVRNVYDIYDGRNVYEIYKNECIGHDGVCHGNHGSQGQCCGGTYCHKSNPTWAEGRCYYRN